MGRESSPYIVGEFWLDKRRDGKAPDIWQIACYVPGTRSIGYRSTKRKSLDEAKAVIHAHDEKTRAKGAQEPSIAKVIPLLFLYWEEHGSGVVSPEQIASSIRCFIGFLMQDEATLDVTVGDLNGQLFKRFREWRMGPHSYEVPWAGKIYRHSSQGVKGESVSRNLDDIRAALGHHASGDNARLPYAPTVPPLPKSLRSPPRDQKLTVAQLGAIVGFAAYDPQTLWFVLLQIATAVRPEAAAVFDPRVQWDLETGLVDLHPADWQRTKKVNPVVPLIPEMAPIMLAWRQSNAPRPASRKRAWRTLRRALGLPADIHPKTIRHSVATIIRARRVRAEDVETLLGHRVLKGTSAIYAKYDPDFLVEAKIALSKLFREIMREAANWTAGHLRAKRGRGEVIVLRRDSPEGIEYTGRVTGGR